MAERVVIAVSGGVDSAVSALLLKEAGYEVTALHMLLGQTDPAGSGTAGEDARRIAESLGLPCLVRDYRRDFQAIVDYFCDSYNRGLTPNPCVRCNPEIKFRKLCECADELGARWIATGHYARVARVAGRFAVRRGADPAKDQSYVLHRLAQEQLARVLFPLGDRTKTDVRERARQAGLEAADAPGSQEVCFAPGRDHARLLRERCADAIRPGPILDADGRVLGEHPGIQFFTIGQRKGLGVALGSPRYVVALDPRRNAVVIGTHDEAMSRRACVRDVVWQALPGLDAARRALVQIRYNHQPVPAALHPLPDGRVLAEFDAPQHAVTPGQAAVFYDRDIVLGGGWIEPPPNPPVRPSTASPTTAPTGCG